MGVDVGGTKIAAAVVSPEGEVLSEVRYPTPHSPEKLVDAVVRAVKEVGDGNEVAGACLAAPGFVMTEENAVVFSPNLHAIEGIPLRDRIEPEIGMPLVVENDASAGAWGEFRFGSGSGVEHLVFLALGTGIGGGVISHGVLLRGAQGAGGELGHVTVQADGPPCACGNRGCLEALASGTAIGRRGREAAVEAPDSALGRIAARRTLLGEDVTELARGGDGAALSVLEETGRWLGVGLAGFVNVFNPEVVAVGGGAMAAGEMILAPARREMHHRARSPSRDLAEVRPAALGPRSGVLGAAALARDEHGKLVLGG